MISAKEIKAIDNKLTFAIGYRNLYNILVLASGFVGVLFTPLGTEFNWIAFVILVLGGKWFLTRMQDNIDTISVAEC
jgi:uncharacterized membrane protein